MGVGGDSGRSSRPVAAASRASSRAGGRGAGGGSFSSGSADNDEEEEGGDGGLESRAARSVLLSGVQRWCLDVSEWELSADQVQGVVADQIDRDTSLCLKPTKGQIKLTDVSPTTIFSTQSNPTKPNPHRACSLLVPSANLEASSMGRRYFAVLRFAALFRCMHT